MVTRARKPGLVLWPAVGLLLLQLVPGLRRTFGADAPAADSPKVIHLAAGQIVCRPGDSEGNLKQIRELSRQAAAAGARLCLFAEGAITGYVTTPSVLAAAPTADGPVAQRLQQMAAELRITIASGTLEHVDRRATQALPE
jgi:hypothetical protein